MKAIETKWIQQVQEQRNKLFPKRNKKRSMTEQARLKPHVINRDILKLRDVFTIEQVHAEASTEAKADMGNFMESVATQRDFKER